MNWNTTENSQKMAAQSVKNAETFWHGLSDFYVKTTHMDDLRTRATIATFARQANILPTDKVLDAGCGHLRISIALMRIVQGVHITGVDLTQELLDEGAKRLKDAQLPPITLVQSDLAHLPFPDNSFDKIVSARVFQYISDPVAVSKELWRVLKPGGRIIMSVPNKLNPIKIARYRGRLHSPSELGTWLTGAGFENVTTGSACFVPGQLRRGWNSSWIALEAIHRLPAIGQIGGNAWASGSKSSQWRM